MNLQIPEWMPVFFLGIALVQFAIGILLLVTQHNYLKQLLGIKIMLQGVALILISEGWRRQELFMSQALVISAFIVEAVILAIALSRLMQLAKKNRATDLLHIQDLSDQVESTEDND
ncbi:MAG: NADH-quinone oxidoreductase subunit K [Anaerolineaceae bacterium]|nr:NADH-quinone oxidoreductase subunit K [Anaerolineaceae bacterium]